MAERSAASFPSRCSSCSSASPTQLNQHGLWLAVRLGRKGGHTRFELGREGECQLHANRSTAEEVARLADLHYMQVGAVKPGS